MSKNYVPLHNHSHYSTLDGFATIEEYVEICKKFGFPGFGLADHGTASGLYRFITKMQSAGLIPVPGVEFYVAPENPKGAKTKEPIFYGKGGKAPKYDVSRGAYTHLTVFAYNNVGLENLFKLSSLSFLKEHFYHEPRIDTNMLAEHSEGLIVTTGCPSSEVSRRFLLGQDDKAYEYASRMKSIFGENYYVEVMNHKMENEELENILIPKQIKLAKDLDIKIIATNDSHYGCKKDAEAHEHFLAMSTDAKMSQLPSKDGGKRFTFSGPEYHVKGYDEMLELFPAEIAEESLQNTLEIMNKCKDIKLEYNAHLRPLLELPSEETAISHFQKLVYEGFLKKRGHQPREIQEESVKRIQEEFKVLHSNDFIDYFLVVEDYISYAHKNNIGVGAGRGCFVPGTKVKANQGVMRNIENIKIGDKVQTHDTTYQIVEDVFIYDVEDEDMIRLTLNNGVVIESTSDHMIFHKQKGFMEAGDFKVGDIVLGPKGIRKKYNINRSSETTMNKQEHERKTAYLTPKSQDPQSGKFISHRQGKKEIYYASSYEQRTLSILETDSDVESFDRCKDVVQYVKPSTGLIHNYLPDFEVVDKNGDVTAIEVKAKWQLEEEDTKSKLKQAEDYYNEKGINYVVWTEDTLNVLNDDWHNDFEVVKVEKFTYTGKVYDIQVANVHNYNVEGVTVHNSVGGSEIAYVLDISNTDPIRFDLLFERFLSPGRGSLYQIDYVSGKSEEIAVSDKKRIYIDDNTSKVIYVHEIKVGDTVNLGEGKDIVKDIFVKIPGSAPDVDTDFHTKRREEVIQYCIDKYGIENVSNIVTFGTFKAKKGFKALCTLYEIPFAVSNKITSLIPGMQGAEPSLGELFDESSKFYKEAADFRNAIAAEDRLAKIIEVGMQLEGRISETGVHPCGVIISSEPLSGIIPTMVRQKDGKVISQWEYPELESLGLIKMDLLGLELIDTIYQTIENIELANLNASSPEHVREVPDMRELIDGEMDDPETYKNLQEGNTIGIFQLGSPGVRELLKMSKPSTFMEIANITALYRPGPMKSGAHIQYANRKNGEEEISYIHPDFHGTEVEEILKETFGLMIFQEQIMLIAGRYAGFTPYGTDKLRKAVGKKKMDVMMKMKKKFVEGCLAKNASESAAETLWETIRVFGEYGFNKSHSVSYAINIYQTIFLKTHYPKEFMAAAIQQAFGTPEKVRSYIQEAKRMKLNVGPVDINNSQVKMASTGIAPGNKYDIIFGFSGIKQMNAELAKSIVDERVENGPYTSVANFVERILKRYNIGAAILGNLALSGAFDCFNVSRKLVKEKAKMLIDSSSKSSAKGLSLFDMMSGPSQNVTEAIVITGEDFTYSEKIKEEASVIGMFLSGHPTSRLGHMAKSLKLTTFEDVLKSEARGAKGIVAGTITEMKSKLNKAGRRNIAVRLDDGDSSVTLYLPKNVVEGIQKGEELQKISSDENYEPNPKLKEIVENVEIAPIKPLETNEPYLFHVARKGFGENAAILVLGITKINLAEDGSMPYEIKVKSQAELKTVEKVVKKHSSKDGFYVRVHAPNGTYRDLPTTIKLSIDFVLDMEKAVGENSIITKSV